MKPIWLLLGGVILAKGLSMRKDSDFAAPHFRFSEFASQKGGPVPAKYRSNVIKAARSHEKVREICGCPLRITDGWRTEEENEETPGAAKNSTHLIALGSDVEPISNYWTPPMLGGVYETLIRQGKIPDGELGIYEDHIHYAPTGVHKRWRG